MRMGGMMGLAIGGCIFQSVDQLDGGMRVWRRGVKDIGWGGAGGGGRVRDGCSINRGLRSGETVRVPRAER
jgi:hypothetical protein